jgi:hypothetical protein
MWLDDLQFRKQTIDVRRIFQFRLLTDSDRYCQWFCGFGSGQHVALAVKYSAWFDDKAWGMDFACDNALGLNFHTAFRKNHAIEFSGNHDVIPLNLTFDTGAFAKDQAMIGNYVSLHVGVYAKNAGRFQRSFKAYSFVEEAGKLVLFLVFVATF